MKVLVLLASPYPAPRGSQLLVQHTERGLRRRGHDVRVVSYGSWLRDRTGLHPARPLLDLATLVRGVLVARRMRADLIHAHNYEAGVIGVVAARLLGIPVVFHGHSRMEAELPSYVSVRWARRALARLGAWLDRTVPRRADHCLAVTTDLGDVLRRAGARHVTVLRPTADPDELDALGPADAEAPTPTIGYAGNLDGYQNLQLLAASFDAVRAELPGARLLIVTHVPSGAPAELLGPHVEIVRARTVEEAWRAIGRAWVAVVPRADRFGHPMKVLNYMAAGKAIVTTAGAAHGLEHDVDAVVVPDGEPKAFASAIAELLRDRERRARLGAAVRDAVSSRVAWDATMDQLEEVYRSVRRRRGRMADAAHATEER